MIGEEVALFFNDLLFLKYKNIEKQVILLYFIF
jgi:hypothetical protein